MNYLRRWKIGLKIRTNQNNVVCPESGLVSSSSSASISLTVCSTGVALAVELPFPILWRTFQAILLLYDETSTTHKLLHALQVKDQVLEISKNLHCFPIVPQLKMEVILHALLSLSNHMFLQVCLRPNALPKQNHVAKIRI